MFVKQVSVFLENKLGRLAEVSHVLGQNNIDISALSIADTTEYGVLRLIVNRPEKAAEILKEDGFSVTTTDVIAISVGDRPGGLTKALDCLHQNHVDIEYMYAFIGRSETGKATVILRVEDTEKAVDVLKKSGIDIMPSSEIYRL